MFKLRHFASLAFLLAVPAALIMPASAQTAAATSSVPADPWPRQVNLANGTVLMYQPQVNSWQGNQIDFRAALAIQPKGAKQESFGVLFATARTQVDRISRTVVFENLQITKSDFPTLPDRGAAYAAGLQTALANDVCRTIRRRCSSATRRRSWCRSTARR